MFDKAETSDLLILAAHQDDCVIMAGEYAITCANAGRQIRLLYFTCGSSAPSDQRAQIRRQESLQAWADLNVSPEHIDQLDFPQSELEGPLKWTNVHREQAKHRLAQTINGLRSGASVFIPAAGESHCDHRALRDLALEILMQVKRPDLRVFESPEYNSYYSLIHCPLRSVCYVVRSLPLLGRLVPVNGAHTRPGFVSGPWGMVLPPDPQRLEAKRRMLRQFASEDGELLVRYFGYSDYFRPVTDLAEARRSSKYGGFYIRLGSRFIAPSILFLWFAIWVSLLLLTFLGVCGLAKVGGGYSATAAVVAALATMAYVIRRAAEWERRITLTSIACGALVGALSVFGDFLR